MRCLVGDFGRKVAYQTLVRPRQVEIVQPDQEPPDAIIGVTAAGELEVDQRVASHEFADLFGGLQPF